VLNLKQREELRKELDRMIEVVEATLDSMDTIVVNPSLDEDYPELEEWSQICATLYFYFVNLAMYNRIQWANVTSGAVSFYNRQVRKREEG